MTTAQGTLRLLKPTDCIKDRLAAYYYWNDQQSLQQAIAVAKQCPFEEAEIKKWSQEEGMENKYRQFIQELRPNP